MRRTSELFVLLPLASTDTRFEHINWQHTTRLHIPAEEKD